MLITSHLAVTLAVNKTLAFTTPEVLVALAGGVAIDLDHLFVNQKWRTDVWRFLTGHGVTHGEVRQRSWLQEPVFGLPAGTLLGVAIAFLLPVRWWVLPLGQGIHIAMDSLMRYEHLPLAPLSSRARYRGWIRSNSMTELAISSLVLMTIVIR